MKEGEVALTSIRQSDGEVKIRPVILLRSMPPFGDFLVCGVSSQIRHFVDGFDEIIFKNDSDFVASGLLDSSLIRLGFLAVLRSADIAGTIGEIAPARHARLMKKLSEYLSPIRSGTETPPQSQKR